MNAIRVNTLAITAAVITVLILAQYHQSMTMWMVFALIWLHQTIDATVVPALRDFTDATFEFVRWMIPPFKPFDAVILVAALCAGALAIAIPAEFFSRH